MRGRERKDAKLGNKERKMRSKEIFMITRRRGEEEGRLVKGREGNAERTGETEE